MKVKVYLCIWLLLLSTAVMGQRSPISGTVVDGETNEPLPGVNILLKNTSIGTVTDMNGTFRLEASPEEVLLLSYIGYVTQEVAVQNRSTLNITMVPDIETLGEVVVIGYGTAKKKEITGAVSVIENESIEGLNPTRIEQALQGQIAGVNIQSTSGSPGGALNIRIRGLSTNGNNNPLILVDGVPYSSDGLAALNPNDIASINVLKDATAGIYGVQAANGVVIITTKKGGRNLPPKINFDGYFGIQETSKKLNLLNATEFAVLKNETFAAGQQSPPYSNTNLGEGTDWQDEVFQTAPIQNYSLSVSGGSENTSYSIGGSLLDQEGIVGGDKSGYKRYNARINIVTDLLPKLTLENVLLYTNENRKTLPENTIGSVLFNAVNASPLDGVRTETGEYTYLMTVNDIINPIAQIENSFNDTRVNKLVGKQELSYEFNNNFKLSGRAGYNYSLVDYKGFSPLVFYGSGKAQNTAADEFLNPTTVLVGSDTVPIPRLSNVTETRTTYFNYNLEIFLNYNRTFGIHEVKSTLGASLFEDRNEWVSGTAFGVPYNSWEFADIDAADENHLLNNTDSKQDRSRLQSIFARAEYTYDGKYILSAIVRRDGSSRFGENNRFGFFPAVSGAWIISDENFYNFDAIDFIKLRTSYGVSGNDKIGNWRYRALLNGEGNYVFNDNLVTGIALGTLGNPDLKWEQTSQFNIGFDLNFLDGRINVTTDYFIKNTKDLLLQPEVSGILGAYGPGSGPPFVNAGDIRNSGFEFLIGYNDEVLNGLKLNVTYNITTLKNEVTHMPDDLEFIPGGAFSVGGVTPTRMQVGYPIGGFFGYETTGVFQTDEEASSGEVVQDGASAGDLRFVDQNNDGSISFSNNSDIVLLGSPFPDFTMGLIIGLEYKGFDLSTNVYSSIGNEIIRNYERQQPLANLLNYRIGRWTGQGTSDEHPRLTTESTRNNVFSDYYVEDGSYVRIKNLQVGYTLPERLLNKVGIERLRVYVSANNLATFTGYKGYDPDITSSDVFYNGIDFGIYPQPRIFMTGLNLTF